MTPYSGTHPTGDPTVQTTIADVTAKALPPLGVSGLQFFGVSLPDWVLILTLVYTVLSIAVLVRDKILRRFKGGDRRLKEDSHEPGD